jgi:uncharacterized membrane protein YagU involved in acid resistance
MHTSSPLSSICVAGLVAGTIDIIYAWLFWFLKAGITPERILQSIAAGLLGRDAAVAGGWPTAALGLLLHFTIALTIAAIYFAAAREVSVLTQRPWSAGALFGVLVYAVMNGIVLPLSAAGPGSREKLWIVLSIVVHAVGIGWPCAYFTRRALGNSPSPTC